MKIKKGNRTGRAALAILSVFVLVMGFMEPISTVAADSYLRLRVSEAVKAMPKDSETTELQSISTQKPSTNLSQVIDANICLTLLNNGIIDGSGYLNINGGQLLTALTNLLLRGELNLGSILNINALVSLLQNGGCVQAQPTQVPPPPPTAVPVQPTAVPVQPTSVPVQPTAVPAQPTAVSAQPTAAPAQPKPSGQNQEKPGGEQKSGVNVEVNTTSTNAESQPVADVELCLVLLGQGVIDVDGKVVVDVDQLPMILARLILSGQLEVGSILNLDALIEILTGGGCANAELPDDSTDPGGTDPGAGDNTDSDESGGDGEDTGTGDAVDPDGPDAPVVDLDLCAALLVNDFVDLDGNLVVSGPELTTFLEGLVTSGELNLGDLANIDALIEILNGGGCTEFQQVDPGEGDGGEVEGTDPEGTDPTGTDPDGDDSTDDGENPPVVDLELCVFLLEEDIIDGDGKLLLSGDTLSDTLNALLKSGELKLGSIADIDALIGILTGGECGDVLPPGETGGDGEGTDPTGTDPDGDDSTDDGENPPVVDLELCAFLLNEDIIDVDGDLAIEGQPLIDTLSALLQDGRIELGSIADVDALIEILTNGGCADVPPPGDTGGDAEGTDPEGTDPEGTDPTGTDPDGDDTTDDGENPPVVDLELCAFLLNEEIIDVDGDLAIEGQPLIDTLSALLQDGRIELGSIADVNALIEILTNGGCADVPPPGDTGDDDDAGDADGTDSDSADADATDTDATDATDDENPPVVDAEVCAVLLENNIIDAEGNLKVDASQLTNLLQALISDGELELGSILTLDVLIAALTDGEICGAADATDADATDADSTDADSTDADSTDADATDADATDADATDADATDADATDADATDADATDADATDADATDADATDADATDADATDADSTDADATDADATDADSTDADATDADATDADSTDADSDDADADATDTDSADADSTDAADADGEDTTTGMVNTFVYACTTQGTTNLEYKSSSDPADGADGCESGTATLKFTSATTGSTYVVSTGANVSGSTASMPLMQVTQPGPHTINGTGVVELPAGTYQVALQGSPSVLTIQVAEGDGNPNLVVTNLATATVTGLPSTGTGGFMSSLVWPVAAFGAVMLLLGGHFVVSTAKSRGK